MDPVAEALSTARNTVIARGWRPGHAWFPALADYRPAAPATHIGARAYSGPVCIISALGDAPGPIYAQAYRSLQEATGAKSLSAWEGTPGRTQADVLAAYAAALNRCKYAAGPP